MMDREARGSLRNLCDKAIFNFSLSSPCLHVWIRVRGFAKTGEEIDRSGSGGVACKRDARVNEEEMARDGELVSNAVMHKHWKNEMVRGVMREGENQLLINGSRKIVKIDFKVAIGSNGKKIEELKFKINSFFTSILETVM
eukprot:TRINITY_DN8327_c0_g1_i1.p1 TRINITY_DN8327_c0_g1~~TRINITY_DN8327_c0_g1_i1.p1  ORF type:complete len:141 (-),score=28.86 TRINITY_DN8327_c0_g1_i1:263-685(-)